MTVKWKKILKNGYRETAAIARYLGISLDATLSDVVETYPFFVNEYYASLINPNDPNDPLSKMAIPDSDEMTSGGSEDTSGELLNTVVPGMQHKYGPTALILSTDECAMYCRHCFRKRLVGKSSDEVAKRLDRMVSYIVEHPEIDNVLVTGGDAFMNSNVTIEAYLDAFDSLDQIKLVRFGSRMPVVLPQRITSDKGLVDILEKHCRNKQVYVVTQFNHPKEVTGQSKTAVSQLVRAGVIVKNQTVLLKGVNDDARTIAKLMTELVANGVVPYYLFQCRPVRGVLNKFQVPIADGVEIVEEAKRALNGQAKCFRYVMSHPTGKIEIVGSCEYGETVFKYHQAKDPENAGKMFIKHLEKGQCWL